MLAHLELLQPCLSSPLSATSEILPWKGTRKLLLDFWLGLWDFPWDKVRHSRQGCRKWHCALSLSLCNRVRNTQTNHGWAAAQHCQTWQKGGKKKSSMFLNSQQLISRRQPLQVSHAEEYPSQFPLYCYIIIQQKLLVSNCSVFCKLAVN